MKTKCFNKIYLLMCVFLFCLMLTSVIAHASLVAQYHFDEGTGTSVSDSSGNSNTGTITGAAWMQLPSGYCLSFDGINDSINCGSGASLNLTNAVTMVAWVCPWTVAGSNNEGAICGKSTSPGASRYLMTFYDNKSFYTYINWGYSGTNTGTGLYPGSWNQVAASYDRTAGTLKVYVNGVLQNQSSYSAAITTGGNFYIGSCGGANTYFYGLIDEVKVYNTALTASEVAAEFNASTQTSTYNGTFKNGAEDGLVAHYPCNESSGTTVNDTSGFLNNGTASSVTRSANPTSADGYALQFSGTTSSKVTCGTKTGLDIVGPITVMAWIKPDSTQNVTEPGLVGKGTSQYMLTYRTNGSTTARFYINSTSNYASAAVTANQWSQIAATYDKSYIKIYVNGAYVAQYAYTSAISSSPSTNLMLGCTASGGTNPFKGYIDEVRVYNRALSATEIKNVYLMNMTPTVRFNSLVTQLVKKQSVSAGSYTWNYTVPNSGWMFFSSNASLGAGNLTITDVFNSTPTTVITHTAANGPNVESMRYFKQGAHQLQVTVPAGGTLTSLDVRAIPELIYSQYPTYSNISCFGPYDWDYLDTFVFKNTNCLTTFDTSITSDSHIADWEAAGKRALQLQHIQDPPAYSTWYSQPGYQNSLGQGLIVDEFLPLPTDSKYDGWATDITNLYSNPEIADKPFYAYFIGNKPWLGSPGLTFVNNVFDNGGFLVGEYYMLERSNQTEADTAFQAMKNDMISLSSVTTNAQRHFVANLGYMSADEEFLNVNPSVDFKAHLDRLTHLLATDITFQDTYGVATYSPSYADEEMLRWASPMFRHYAIEGNRGFLSDAYGYAYNVDYVKNPDFASGTANWTLYPANSSPVSISTGTLTDWSWLEGRYPQTSQGDTYVKLTRYANAPNYIEQTITGLTVGKWYSVKMIAADYDDMLNGISSSKDLAVRIYLTSGGVVDPKKSYKQTVHSNWSHEARGFNSNNYAYMNFFRVVFKATATSATLRISDWSSDAVPGGSIGQNIMCNFIEFQPYFSSVQDGLVAYYKFDETSGDSVKDSSHTLNSGTIYGGTNRISVNGGAALYFDGVNNYIDCGISPHIDLKEGATISTWVAPSAYQNASEPGIVGKNTWSYLLTYYPANSRCYWYINNGGYNVGTAVSPNTWSLVTATYDGAYLKIYVNGIYQAQYAYSGTISSSDANLYIGCQGVSAGVPVSPFKGFIDDVKIYNRALSADEVSLMFTTAEQTNRNSIFAANGGLIQDSLVAFYKFDEASGATAIDSSGFGNTGTVHGGVSKISVNNGYALSLDGVKNYVDGGSSALLDPKQKVSVSAWVAPSAHQNASEPGIVGKGYWRYLLTYYPSNSSCYWYINNGGNNVGTSVPSGSSWSLVTATYDGTTMKIYVNGVYQSQYSYTGTIPTGSSLLLIGCSALSGDNPTAPFKGFIDDVRVYNCALSSTDVGALYNASERTARNSIFAANGGQIQDGLAAYYKMDENSGTTLTDSSGFGNNGTIHGASWLKVADNNYALDFDGVINYVDCGNTPSLNITGPITTISWICPWSTQYSSETGILGKGYNSFLLTYYLAGGSSYWYINNGGYNTGTSVSWDTWTQIATTYDGSALKIYINGSLQNQSSYTGQITPTDNNLHLGCIYVSDGIPTSPFKGVIDDVRIYNYAMSAAEISSQFSSSEQNTRNAMFSNGVEDSKVAHYTLSEGSGNSIADRSGHGNTGTLSNVTWTTRKTGTNALVFNGTSSYIDCGDGSSVDIAGPMTLISWVYPNSSQNYSESGVVGKWYSSYLLSWYTGNNNSYFYIDNGGNHTNYGLSTNTWSQVTTVFDPYNLDANQKIRMYINGVLRDTSSSAYNIINDGGHLYLGCYDYGGTLTGFFNGRIGDIRVYNRVLTNDEIEDLYNP